MTEIRHLDSKAITLHSKEAELFITGLKTLLYGFIREAVEDVLSEVLVQPQFESKAAPSDTYLTPKETWEFLRISKTTLWRRTKFGKIPCYMVNGKKLYKKVDVEGSFQLIEPRLK